MVTTMDDDRCRSPEKPPSAGRVLESAFRILARRDHTCKELSVKLRGKGFGHTAVRQTLVRCRELGYLDDARTAGVMAEHLVARGYGPRRVRQTLLQKGLDESLVLKALTRCGDEESQVRKARRMLAKKTARLERESDAWKRRRVAYRYLAGRGFTSEVIDRAIKADL